MKVIHLKHVGALHNCLTDQKLPPDGGNTVHVSLVLHLSDLQTLKTSQCLPATRWHRKGLTVNLNCEDSETKSHYSFFVSWRIVSGLKNTECPGFHSKKKKKRPFREVRKYVSILMLLIIFKYLTACFKLVHPYKMVSLSLLTSTETKVIFLKCWAPEKHDHRLWKIHIYWQQLSSKVSV